MLSCRRLPSQRTAGSRQRWTMRTAERARCGGFPKTEAWNVIDTVVSPERKWRVPRGSFAERLLWELIRNRTARLRDGRETRSAPPAASSSGCQQDACALGRRPGSQQASICSHDRKQVSPFTVVQYRHTVRVLVRRPRGVGGTWRTASSPAGSKLDASSPACAALRTAVKPGDPGETQLGKQLGPVHVQNHPGYLARHRAVWLR